jgi:ATP-dependent Lon protease
VVDALVQDYCMGEPGVRYLEKNIVRILEKIAYKIVTNEEPVPITVTKENLHKYLGNTYFREKDHTKITKGVAISLGGGEYGGRLTYIEAFKKSHLGPKEHKRGLLFTGSLGNVFK